MSLQRCSVFLEVHRGPQTILLQSVILTFRISYAGAVRSAKRIPAEGREGCKAMEDTKLVFC